MGDAPAEIVRIQGDTGGRSCKKCKKGNINLQKGEALIMGV
jgi:hypothetical protein